MADARGERPADADAGELDTFRIRVRDTLIKSAREARANTSWAAPNEAFEAALRTLINAVFDRPRLCDSLADFATGLARAGRSKGLVQTVLKLTVPGVPDVYQGAELWDLNLVDPDNRRPVDFERRAALLAATLDGWQRDPGAAVRELASQPESGAIKQLTIAVVLAHRREHAELYERGAYQPLPAPASFGAFERAHAAGRLRVMFRLHSLASAPPFGLALPDGRWENLLTRAPLDANQDFDTVSGGLPFVVAAAAQDEKM